MDNKVWEFLQSHRSEGLFHTHVSMYDGSRGSFCIDRSKIDNFWDIYVARLSKVHEMKSGVAEKPQQYLPVLVDVDITRKIGSHTEATPIYTQRHIERLVGIYQDVLKHIIDECTDENLKCIFLKKDPYIKEAKGVRILKHGFHLHFPYIFLNRIDHETHLVPRIKELVSKERLFFDVGFTDSGSLIDPSYVSVPWLLYGSSKAITMEPYIASHGYTKGAVKSTIEDVLEDYEIFDCNEDPVDMKKEGVLYHLPRILSIVLMGRDSLVCDLRPSLPSPQTIKKRSKAIVHNSDEIAFATSLKEVGKYIELLSSSRASDRLEWMKVGWALFCIGSGCEEAKKMWISFSSRCPEKFDEDACDEAWDKMVNRGITIRSLQMWAKYDSPEEYAKIKKNHTDKSRQQAIAGAHNDVAKALFQEWGSDYVCAAVGRAQLWYRFRNHTWEETPDGISLRQKISLLVEKYGEDGKTLLDQFTNAEDEGEKAMYSTRLKQLGKLVLNLKNAPFKTNVMRECAEVFYDGSFLKKLDKNPYLIGFQNGVYDCATHTFREGSPDDYISLKMAVEYRKFDPDDWRLKQVEDFFLKVFPDKSLRDYFLSTSSRIFVGGNHDKIVQVWSGEGDNAKSVTQTLFEKMLGQYAIKLPTSLIIGKRAQSGAACPELVRAGNGVRFAVLQEPDQKDVINIGILKELSGNDTFFARGLYKAGGEMEPMFKVVLICNEPPQLPYGDKAIWNRIRMVPFESTFIDSNHGGAEPVADTLEEQLKQKRFPVDRQFSDKIPGMIQAFAYLLLEYRKHHRDYKEPPKVLAATAGYRKRNDSYRQFIEEMIIDDPSSKLSLSELYGDFKIWFKESLPNHQIPIKNDVLTYFTKAWGDPRVGVKWKGKRSRTAQDDIIEDEDEDEIPDI